MRESISRRSSGALYGEPFNEVDDSTPRVVKVRWHSTRGGVAVWALFSDWTPRVVKVKACNININIKVRCTHLDLNAWRGCSRGSPTPRPT